MSITKIKIMNIGQTIRKFRNDRKISQENLAFACDISRAYMYKIEAGKSNPTINVLEKIAKELGVYTYEIVKCCEIGKK